MYNKDAETYDGITHTATEIYNRMGQHKPLTKTQIGGYYLYLIKECGYDEPTVDVFFQALANPAVCPEMFNIFSQLRENLLLLKGSKGGLSKKVWMIATWNAYAKGKKTRDFNVKDYIGVNPKKLDKWFEPRAGSDSGACAEMSTKSGKVEIVPSCIDEQ